MTKSNMILRSDDNSFICGPAELNARTRSRRIQQIPQSLFQPTLRADRSGMFGGTVTSKVL